VLIILAQIIRSTQEVIPGPVDLLGTAYILYVMPLSHYKPLHYTS